GPNPTPALLTSTSSRSWRSRTVSASARTSARDDRSARTGSPPVRSATSARRVGSRPCRIRRWPASARSYARARPSPSDAPVIRISAMLLLSHASAVRRADVLCAGAACVAQRNVAYGGPVDHVRDLVATHLPGQPVRSVTRLGEGSDHVAYQVDGLIVRFRRGPGAARDVSREADLLAEVGGISPVAVPQPAFVAPEQGCLAYRRLPGRPLLHLPRPRRAALGQQVAAVLGAELAALHTAPVARMADLVPADDTSLAEWRDEAAGRYAEVAGEIPAGYRQRVEAFLASTVPAGGW